MPRRPHDDPFEPGGCDGPRDPGPEHDTEGNEIPYTRDDFMRTVHEWKRLDGIARFQIRVILVPCWHAYILATDTNGWELGARRQCEACVYSFAQIADMVISPDQREVLLHLSCGHDVVIEFGGRFTAQTAHYWQGVVQQCRHPDCQYGGQPPYDRSRYDVKL